MRKTRVFVETALAPGGTVDITGGTAHYLDRVLRLREGALVELFDGRGGSFDAEILGRERKTVSLRLIRRSGEDRESPLALTLIQGISRGQHMDYTVQKAVELGIRRIVPVYTDFSNIRMDADRARKKLDHWRGVIISACEQCGRNLLPEIAPPVAITAWLPQDDNPLKLVLHPDAEPDAAMAQKPGGPVSLLCGPEGGFSDEEYAAALSAGYQPVSLGPRILRTETAAVAAIVRCQTLWGDMQ